MKTRLTVVIEYDREQDAPGISAGMKALGGNIVAVQFNDALAELKEMEDKMEDMGYEAMEAAERAEMARDE